MEEACSRCWFLCGETEARGSRGGRTSCLVSFRGSVPWALQPLIPERFPFFSKLLLGAEK